MNIELFERIDEVVTEAAAGDKESAAWIKTLGLNIKELQDLSSEERLSAWITGLENMTDGSDKQWIALSTLPTNPNI